ncbi:MerR family DNA-binding transcriptional regulator [Candidatus Uhrbacteria bacterium]|nr:MerR family DNA-binding transcriptional regulator [Candidatus Uhrbacteria bacterium]
MSTLMTVVGVAEKLGVSTDTIRRWEKKGLIKETREENNYRVFDLHEVLRTHEKLIGSNPVGENHFKILKAKVCSHSDFSR